MQLNPAMRLLSLLPRASVAAMTPRIRNRRSAWAVRGSLPRRVSLTIATIGFLLPFLAWCDVDVSALRVSEGIELRGMACERRQPCL